MQGIWAWVAGVIAALGLIAAAQADSSLSAQQAAAQKEQAALQQRITALQQRIEGGEEEKKDVTSALRDVESRISSTDTALFELNQSQQQEQAKADELAQQVVVQEKIQSTRQQQLAEQLRAQYASGLSPWTALLSGNDPQQIQRELGYLAYISKAQAQQVKQLQQGLAQLEQLQAQQKASQAQLAQLAADTAKQKEQLLTQQAERQAVLVKIDAALQQQRTEAKTLAANEARLGHLVIDIQREIKAVKEEEKKRKAAIKIAEATPQQGFYKGMLPPVQGRIQGRFGTERPEGGPWRGIIFRTEAGTPVKAIAPGQVVFANWMTGFGNLLIIDHGEGFLSVYGHNQSLLRQVGERVVAGEEVAKVGATGGQMEPGVYFEIRQNGQPVNPQLWLGS